MLFRSQNTSVAIWSSLPAGLRFVQVSDLPRHENISTLDLVSNKTKGSQAHTYCHDCHGETLFNISTPVVTWCRKKHLAARKFLALHTKLAKTFTSRRRSKISKNTWNRYTRMRDIAAYPWWKRPSPFGHFWLINYLNESDMHDNRVCRIFSIDSSCWTTTF